jgi:hypothetical protein
MYHSSSRSATGFLSGSTARCSSEARASSIARTLKWGEHYRIESEGDAGGKDVSILG